MTVWDTRILGFTNRLRSDRGMRLAFAEAVKIRLNQDVGARGRTGSPAYALPTFDKGGTRGL